ncbi:MAG: hypothetical protein L3K26_00405 [Candidatus Hydrogenedentes bacterium]|nr:hypothetical protein [Candidatus Hydrogenedentota bacterium]
MVEILKKRTVTVRETTESKGETRLRDILAAVPGVKEVELLGTRELCIQYDLAKLRFRQIEENIRALGFELPNGFLSRWKRSWIDFTEENEYNNMMAKPAPCCSNPKGITSASRRK